MPSLLLITPHFPPSAASGAFRMLGFAKHLPELGWKVTVVTCADYGWEPTDPDLSRSVPSSVKVHSIPFPLTWRARVILSLVNIRPDIWDVASEWSRRVMPLVKRVANDVMPEVVLTTGPPHSVHMLGSRVKKLTGAQWVADFRDPWVAGQWNGIPSRFLERRRERSVVRAADLVIANAPKARDAYREQYPESDKKFVVVTNGYDTSPLPPRRPTESGPIRLLHAGEIYAGRDPRPLFDSLARVQGDAKRLQVSFFGRTAGMDLEEEAQSRGLAGRVHAHGQVSSTVLQEAMVDADVLLLLDTPGRKIGVPAKLYEYIGTGRPVLALAEHGSDTEWALRESGIQYALAPPHDLNAIDAALIKILAQTSVLSTAPPQAARFTRASVARRLSDHLSNLLDVKPSAYVNCEIPATHGMGASSAN